MQDAKIGMAAGWRRRWSGSIAATAGLKTLTGACSAPGPEAIAKSTSTATEIATVAIFHAVPTLKLAGTLRRADAHFTQIARASTGGGQEPNWVTMTAAPAIS